MEDDTVEDAAHRELKEETGLEGLDLHLVGPFSGKNRDPRERIITIAYYAWTEASAKAVAADDAASLDWHSLHMLPELAFDHAVIMERVRELAGV